MRITKKVLKNPCDQLSCEFEITAKWLGEDPKKTDETLNAQIELVDTYADSALKPQIIDFNGDLCHFIISQQPDLKCQSKPLVWEEGVPKTLRFTLAYENATVDENGVKLTGMENYKAKNCVKLTQAFPTGEPPVPLNEHDCAEFDVKKSSKFDLEVTKKLTSPCQEGAAFCEFEITVKNNGPGDRTGTIPISDDLNLASTFTGSWSLDHPTDKDNTWFCMERKSPHHVDCVTRNSVTLKKNDSITLTLGLKLSGSTRGGGRTVLPFRNCAYIPLLSLDHNPGNEEGCVRFFLQPPSPSEDYFDLEVTKTGDYLCYVGGSCSFGIAIKNVGTKTFEGTLNINDGLTSLTGGKIEIIPPTDIFWQSKDIWTCSISGKKGVSCSTNPGVIITLPPGQSLTPPLSIGVELDGDSGELRNCAGFPQPPISSSGEQDPNPKNDSSCWDVEFSPTVKFSPPVPGMSGLSTSTPGAAETPPSPDELADNIYGPLGEALSLIPQIEPEPGNPHNLTDEQVDGLRKSLQSLTMGLAEAVAGAMIQGASQLMGVEQAITQFQLGQTRAAAGDDPGALAAYKEAFRLAATAFQNNVPGPTQLLPFQLVVTQSFLSVQPGSSPQLTGVALGLPSGQTDLDNITVEAPAGIQAQVTQQGAGVFTVGLDLTGTPIGDYPIKLRVQAGSMSAEQTVDLRVGPLSTKVKKPGLICEIAGDDKIISGTELIAAIQRYAAGELTGTQLIQVIQYYASGTACDQPLPGASAAAASATPFSLEDVGFTGSAFVAEGAGIVALEAWVYDLAGRLDFSGQAAGNTLAFSGLNSDGRVLANGVYLYTVTAYGLSGEAERSRVKKLVLLR